MHDHAYLLHYRDLVDSARENDPSEYVKYLRGQPRFRDGSLKNLPDAAIILHDTRLEEHLAILGISSTRIRPVQTGTTDPKLLYIVYPEGDSPGFIMNRGLPGGGGITTQAAASIL